MTTGLSDVEAEASGREDACLAGASTADVLRLLGAGATGAILMALGEGPLRTKSLTERVPGYAPRTIYRYANKLSELEVIEREEVPGVPSKVIHSLTDPCGTELFELVNRFADASLTRLPDGRLDAHSWASLGLLADLWEGGLVEELSCEARSPSDLARGSNGLSYHQVNRRAGLFKVGGLLYEGESSGRRRCYGLTVKARRKMGLIVGIARWRHHHVVGEGEEGLSATGMATVLRVALPLLKLPDHGGRCLRFGVRVADADAAEVWVEVEADGTVQSCANPPARPDGWARGTVGAWVTTLLDGDAQAVLVGEDEKLVDDCFDALYTALWSPKVSELGTT